MADFVTPGNRPLTTQRCESTSPVVKFDEGPVQCEREAGHAGDHRAADPVEHRVVGQPVYSRTWDDDGGFVR